MSFLRSLEQNRAKFAYEAVARVKKASDLRNKEIQKKYSSYVKSAPVLILTNGLANALAFYLSKIKDKETEYDKIEEKLKKKFEKGEKIYDNKAERVAYAYLFYQVSEWLAERANNGGGLTRGQDPLKFICDDADVHEMMQLTRETINLLNWMRRFADAMLEKEEEE